MKVCIIVREVVRINEDQVEVLFKVQLIVLNTSSYILTVLKTSSGNGVILATILSARSNGGNSEGPELFILRERIVSQHPIRGIQLL